MAKSEKGSKGAERVESDGTAVNTSVESSARDQVAEALTKATADSYTLYAKTLGVHWNVQGASFYGLHNMTEAQYQELHEAADAIAERIRALGKLAPTGNASFRELTVIDNDAPHKPTRRASWGTRRPRICGPTIPTPISRTVCRMESQA
jgi:starvation-inducible DNA-binding protein